MVLVAFLFSVAVWYVVMIIPPRKPGNSSISKKKLHLLLRQYYPCTAFRDFFSVSNQCSHIRVHIVILISISFLCLEEVFRVFFHKEMQNQWDNKRAVTTCDSAARIYQQQILRTEIRAKSQLVDTIMDDLSAFG